MRCFEMSEYIKLSKFTDNDFIEAYAAFALIEAGVVNIPFSKDWLKDRPDLQIGNFGIEVVEAITTSEGKQRNFLNQCLECDDYEEAKTLNNSFHNSELTVEKLGDTNYPVLTSGVKIGFITTFQDIIVARINEKSKKFQNFPNFNKFTRKGVFVCANDPMMLLYNNFAKIQQEISKCIFDIVFILFPFIKTHGFSRDNLIVIEKSEDKIQTYRLDNNKNHQITFRVLEILYGTDSSEYIEYAKYISEYEVYEKLMR
jgi:hypothetical protein